MVLTQSELIASLKFEVHILLHLAGKVDSSMLDYRPTPGQRSTLELMQFLSYMGPGYLDVAIAGKFDPPAWTVLEREGEARSFDETVSAIATHSGVYESRISAIPEEEMRAEIRPFGHASSRGSWIVNQVLCACAAYRTQLFLYLKACGRHELSTINLWAGMDPKPRA
jgi:hypothetical protein